MKLIHISDLHLGIRLYDYSLLEDQEFILKRILEVVDAERPDGILIAGDIFDKPVPPAEAVRIFDNFLSALAARPVQVYAISGNHDSPERVSFGARLMDRSGVHIAPVYDGTVTRIPFEDGYGPGAVYLLPFLKPAHVRRFFPDEEIATYTDALRTALSTLELDKRERKVLITHQFVTGARRSDSEEVTVGRLDNVDASVFDGFDYVALGHLHTAQTCGRDTVRYCGTPLKYSFSEAKDRKTVTVVELREKGSVEVRTLDLEPMRDLVELKGRYEDLTRKSYYEGTSWRSDYIHITLTDEEDIFDAVGKLRTIYHNLMRLDYDNTRTRAHASPGEMKEPERKTPLKMFGELFEKQNGRPMEPEQIAYVQALLEEIAEEETL